MCYEVANARREPPGSGTGRRTPRPRTGRRQVGVRELRQNLSVHLRRIERGEVLEVTDRGRPVALLGPLPERMTALQRLEAQGLIARRASIRLEDLGPPLAIKVRVPLSRILEDLRADRV